jgi:oligopeptide transport system substrate-binding protein
MSAGEFDLVLAALGPDYNDLSTFSDLFYSKNNNNHGRYNNPDYDYWTKQAMNNTDATVRMNAFSQLQDIIYEDARSKDT